MEQAEIFVSAGTADARELVTALLNRGYSVLATVVSDWGAELLERGMNAKETAAAEEEAAAENGGDLAAFFPEKGSLAATKAGGKLRIHTGRLDEKAFAEAFQKHSIRAVIDASHPYANILHQNVKRAAAAACLPYFRLHREALAAEERNGCRAALLPAQNAEEAARLAGRFLKTGMNVLLTTGAKDLELYSRIIGPEQLVVRVLPLLQSLKACAAAGIPSDRIIAMQGPFSEDLNRALIRACHACLMISKDGGRIGGFPEKVRAAAAEGIPLIVIRRPEEADSAYEKAYGFFQAEELLEALKKELGRARQELDGRFLPVRQLKLAKNENFPEQRKVSGDEREGEPIERRYEGASADGD